jgi:hypothetical protein
MSHCRETAIVAIGMYRGRPDMAATGGHKAAPNRDAAPVHV